MQNTTFLITLKYENLYKSVIRFLSMQFSIILIYSLIN